MLKLLSSLFITLIIMNFANAENPQTAETPDADTPDGEDTPQAHQYRQGTPPGPLRSLDFTPFDAAINALASERIAQLDAFVSEATVATLQGAFDNGILTIEELVTYY